MNENCCLCGNDKRIIPMCQRCFDKKLDERVKKIAELKIEHEEIIVLLGRATNSVLSDQKRYDALQSSIDNAVEIEKKEEEVYSPHIIKDDFGKIEIPKTGKLICNEAFNQAIDQMKPYIAKLKQEIEELKNDCNGLYEDINTIFAPKIEELEPQLAEKEARINDECQRSFDIEAENKKQEVIIKDLLAQIQLESNLSFNTNEDNKELQAKNKKLDNNLSDSLLRFTELSIKHKKLQEIVDRVNVEKIIDLKEFKEFSTYAEDEYGYDITDERLELAQAIVNDILNKEKE